MKNWKPFKIYITSLIFNLECDKNIKFVSENTPLSKIEVCVNMQCVELNCRILSVYRSSYSTSFIFVFRIFWNSHVAVLILRVVIIVDRPIPLCIDRTRRNSCLEIPFQNNIEHRQSTTFSISTSRLTTYKINHQSRPTIVPSWFAHTYRQQFPWQWNSWSYRVVQLRWLQFVFVVTLFLLEIQQYKANLFSDTW